MGDVAGMMLEGILCECCGGFLGEDVIIANGGKIMMRPPPEKPVIMAAPGFPIKCEDCGE